MSTMQVISFKCTNYAEFYFESYSSSKWATALITNRYSKAHCCEEIAT